MDFTESWRTCFTGWPEDLPRRGVVVTSFGEQIQFSNFLASPAMLLIERQTPDTVGARQVIVPYQFIQAVKIIDVVKMKSLLALGFEERKK